jgi:hypothetical protein
MDAENASCRKGITVSGTDRFPSDDLFSFATKRFSSVGYAHSPGRVRHVDPV